MPPAIFSHQGLILPLKMRSPKKFDGTALCVGAGMPDLMVLVTKITNNEYYHYINHSLLAFSWLIPLTVLFTILLSRYVLPFISKKLPKSGIINKIGVYFGIDDFYLLEKKQFTKTWFGIAFYSAFIGIASHLMMDLLGHYVNPVYIPFRPVSFLPIWFSTETWMLFGQARTNSDAVFLIMTFVFGLFSLIWLRIIKKENLLKKWYNVLPSVEPINTQQPPIVNIYTDCDEFEYKEFPPFEPDKWMFKKNMAIKRQPLRLWTRPTTKNIMIVLITLIVLDIIIEMVLELALPQFYEEQAPLWMRLFSISHITAYLIVIVILFDEKFIRSLFLLFLPLAFVLLYVVIFILIPDPSVSANTVLGILISHSLHFAAYIYCLVKKKWSDWQYLLHASIIYFVYFIILWLLIPDYKMIYVFGLTETLIIHTISSWIMILTTFIVERFNKHGKPVQNPQ